MDRRSTRQEKALQLSKTQSFTPYCTVKCTESNHYSQQNTIRMKSILHGIGIVTHQHDQHTFHVNLDTATCSCKRYQDTLVPCGHAITTIHRIRRAPIEYVPSYAKRGTLIRTYTQNFPPKDPAEVELVYLRGRLLGKENSNCNDSDSSGLSEPLLDDCESPLTRVPRGRRSNKRKRKGDGPPNIRNLRRRLVEPGALPDIPDRAPAWCSTCKGLGHNARGCTRPHT